MAMLHGCHGNTVMQQLPDWQYMPVYPSVHMQLKLLTLSTQVALCRHGLDKHLSTSTTKIYTSNPVARASLKS